jgi:HPt (histidine-containing phosphotransfer) domain-containing protein
MIDQEIALSMLMHNERIYHNLLKRFYDSYKDYPTTLKDLYLNEDKEFYRIVHNIKGISLNLGACKLFEISDLINKAYKQNSRIDNIEIVDELIIELKLVNDEIIEIINGR